LPPASIDHGRVGSYWYHGGTRAYFDDRRQYRKMTMECVKPPCAASQGGTTVVNNLGARPSQPVAGGVNVNLGARQLDRVQCACVVSN
ncbi:hypothetical protein BAE44_0004879, partial [Dichanthelium oligosanthes]